MTDKNVSIWKVEEFLIDNLKELPIGNGKFKIKAECSMQELLEKFENYMKVEEVDLCKEEERIWKDFNMGERHLSKNDLEKISKYFFELGLKAQKGEEV